MQFGFKISDAPAEKSREKMGGVGRSLANLNSPNPSVAAHYQNRNSINEIIGMMGAIPLFDKIGSLQLGVIAAHMEVLHLEEGELLFGEGEKSDYMCFVVSGQLEVFKQSKGGNRIPVSTILRGRSIGEMAMMDELPRSASVVALEPCTLLSLTREGFEQILAGYPQPGITLLKALSRMVSLHLRLASGQLADARESIRPAPVKIGPAGGKAAFPLLMKAKGLFAH